MNLCNRSENEKDKNSKFLLCRQLSLSTMLTAVCTKMAGIMGEIFSIFYTNRKYYKFLNQRHLVIPAIDIFTNFNISGSPYMYL